VNHRQARDNYRVIARVDGDEIEIGSIGIRLGAGTSEGWTWGIDCVTTMRDTEGRGHRQGPVECSTAEKPRPDISVRRNRRRSPCRA
jgi:hypothetical protein